MELPPTVVFNIDDQPITIHAFNSSEAKQSLNNQAVNIIASGPSAANLAFSELIEIPTIFVNGSISLLAQHDFTQVVGWVISDARFINHQPEILKNHYTGQSLYATLAVFEALAAAHPDIMHSYHSSMRILYPVDRPWGVKSNRLWFSKLTFKKKLLNKKKPLSYFVNDPNFVIDSSHKPAPIGVSLDVTYGFVEAGTVAYVAAQLAFSRSVSIINLYGIDLLNSAEPRFYENKDNSAPSKLDKAITDRIVPSFNLLGKVYKEHGVPIVNHSAISKNLFNSFD
ncbi:hypothetical protein [Psychrobacter sp. TAE2020]|uniref:hypothetical protein n=1 Tax=Psychrobacter sp. TAE2020 TaxID=2846762 RepID=UPI001E42D9B1|nr:hypothetical protein [Psychrobacter sp. TAE2020]